MFRKYFGNAKISIPTFIRRYNIPGRIIAVVHYPIVRSSIGIPLFGRLFIFGTVFPAFMGFYKSFLYALFLFFFRDM